MLRTRIMITALLCGFSVSGCATLRGSQDAVPELQPVGLVPIRDALFNNHKPNDSDRAGMSRLSYREYVLSSYIAGIEQRYKAFVDQLQAGDRGSALGLDLLQLGIAGTTALAGASSAQDLATIGAIAAGTRSSIDKRLYFDRTLPAVIASMNAERATILADIEQKRSLPTTNYSLDSAVSDLNRLQNAGRLDVAIARMTETAQADKAAAEARLEGITAACDDIPVGTGQLTKEFRELVEGSATVAAKAAEELQVPNNKSQLLSAFATKLCGNEMKREFIDSIK
ncbi:MAG: hypothetical protein RL481_1760 [Pseudomonadota bacterium]